MKRVRNAVMANADELAPIISAGAVGVVVMEPGGLARQAARALGWDGRAAVFEMSDNARRRLSERSDAVTGRWLDSERNGRIFVICDGGSLLLNFTPGHGFAFQPGSLHRERV